MVATAARGAAGESLRADARAPPGARAAGWPAPPPETDPIGSLGRPGQATVEGRVRAAEIRSGQTAGTSVLACEVADSSCWPSQDRWP